MKATVANNCVGIGGIVAGTASGCSGYGAGEGLRAGNAFNSHGSSSGGLAQGIVVDWLAVNCFGFASGSGTGLEASVAVNCYGFSNGDGIGLKFYKIAAMCYAARGSPAAVDSILGGGAVGPRNLP